ncbi:MAG: hypothetical protein AB7L76_09920 [Burkholderiaceae bacterium]
MPAFDSLHRLIAGLRARLIAGLTCGPTCGPTRWPTPGRVAAATAAFAIAAASAATAGPAATRCDEARAVESLGAAGACNTAGWLPLADVYQRLITQGHRDVLSIERRSLGYEAIVPDADEGRVRLFIDPRTGRTLGRQPAH